VLAKLKALFSSDETEQANANNLQLACAALMMEVATIDQNYDESEQASLIKALSQAFALNPKEAEEIETLARESREDATSLHEFTRQINEQASPEQKFLLLEAMWRVAYADGELDKYEEHIIRRACDLIHLGHSDFIRAKLSAKAQ